jgi:sodium-dependent dicarboxylate transporter 2/3/5
MMALYTVTVKFLFPNGLSSSGEMQEMISRELRQLGPLSRAEKRVLLIFVCTALLWITRDLINSLQLIRIDDNMIAIFGALLMFIVPSGMEEHKLLEWKDTKNMAWGSCCFLAEGSRWLMRWKKPD